MKTFRLTTTTWQTLRIYWRYTWRYPTDFLVGSIGAGLAVITQGMVPPLIIARTFSKLQFAYARHQTLHFSEFLPYFVWFTAAMLAGVVFWRLQSYYVWQLEIKVRRDQANDVYDHLQAQSQRFHADRFGGALVSQTNKFVNSYERLMDDFIWNIVPSLVTLVAAVAVLAYISYPYALALLALTVVYLLIMSRRVIRQMPYNIDQATADSLQTAALADAITNLNTIRAFAGEKYETKRFHGVTDRTYKAYRKLSIEVFKTEALSHFQTNGFQIAALFGGLVAVTTYHTNVSLLYLVISYTQNLVNQLWQFSRIMRNLNRSFGDAAEMTEILGVQPEIKDPAGRKKLRVPRGEVRFDNVSFAYPENRNEPLFKRLSFKIKAGEKVGLVGPSGGGKTTVTTLLLRFMDVQQGVISVDGQDIATVSQRDLRSHIAYVPQEPILFHRSLAENIAYGAPGSEQAAIEAVAKMAHADEFISQLPEDYKTFVGERGVKLSGGQRQRVAIARAMLKNAPILVLDEATSALDSESEVLIQDALWKLMESRTAIVIAHRLSTIQKMDRILVMEDGQIVEEGSHKELLARDGVYAKLWAHQSGGFIEE